MTEAAMNVDQLCGYEISGAPIELVEFDGVEPVEASETGQVPPQLRLYASVDSGFDFRYVEETCSWVGIWGAPVHRDRTRADIPAWCARAVGERRYERFRELTGIFVIIVDEPREHRITIVTDVLGIRPMFTRSRPGRLVFGSDVWALHRAGFSQGRIDYDSVSSWIHYRYPCTGGSLFTDLVRLPPGSAMVFQDGKSEQFQYARFEKLPSPSSGEMFREVHDMIRATVKTLVDNTPRFCVPLSGGFDSRYLAALVASLAPDAGTECLTVGVGSWDETPIAKQVAERLGLAHRIFAVAGSEWELHSEPFHFTADGFPISKSVPDHLVHKCPGIPPMFNGFLGGSIMRGRNDRIGGKHARQHTTDLAKVLQERHRAVENQGLFREEIELRIQERSLVPMEEGVRKGSSIDQPFGWVDFHCRQRFWLSNNFLQHLGHPEELLPFYSWPLLSYKMGHDSMLFDDDFYPKIFDAYFPSLSDIPHAADVLSHPVRTGIVGCARTWARELLPRLLRRDSLTLIRRKRAAYLLAGGIAGDVRAESSVFALKRLTMLEDRIRNAGLDFDWEAI